MTRTWFSSLIMLLAAQSAMALGGPDFNGDGFEDLAVGAPLEDIAGVDAGAIHVIYGSASGLIATGNQFLHQNNLANDDGPQPGDNFGAALAWGDFNGDGFDDLAVGVPGEDVGPIVDAGSVHIIYGSSGGLVKSTAKVWHQDRNNIADSCQANDRFGDSLAAGDFDNDGFTDLAVGVPGQSVGGFTGAGAVHIFYGSATGIKPPRNRLFHQNSSGILETAEASDNFADALAVGDFNGDGYADLAIGVEDEDVGTVNEAGLVHIIYGSANGLNASNNQVWHQNSLTILDEVEHFDHLGDSLAAGDFNGDGYDDLAISVELEDVGGTDDAGIVHIIYGSPTGLTDVGNQVWHQNSAGIQDTAEAGDHFASFLRTGDFNGDGFIDLAIGVEDEAIGSVLSAGAVHVLYGSLAGLSASGAQFWHQNVAGVIETCETGDGFGDSLAAGDYDGDGRDDLAIGVPGENIGAAKAGAVAVLYGEDIGLTADGDQIWHQNRGGIWDTCENNDQFGSAL